MTSLPHAYQAYQRSIERLRAHAVQDNTVSRESVGRELEVSLLELRNDLTALSGFLKESEERFGESQRVGRAWEMYDTWSFDKIPELDRQAAEQLLPSLVGGPQLAALLGQVEELYRNTATRKEALEQRILAAWRAHYPRFSSMGTLDSDVESETIKDPRQLARR